MLVHPSDPILILMDQSFIFQSLISNTNLYSDAKGADQVTDKIVSLSFFGSKDDGSVDVDGDECKVKGLEEEIRVVLPRNNTAKDSPGQEVCALISTIYMNLI